MIEIVCKETLYAYDAYHIVKSFFPEAEITQKIKEEQYPFQYSGVVGLAVNVSNIFFDFRYEVGLHNTIRSITYNTDLTEAPHNEGKIKLEQRKNILSFSVGVIF